MTATQWLIQQLLSVGRLQIEKNDYVLNIIEQAKEIEKIQIIDAHVVGHNAPSSTIKNWDAEQYFNETYKNTNK